MPDAVEKILSRFPGPVTLYASRKKWGWVLVVASAFTGIFVYALFLDQSERDPAPFFTIIFWNSLLFFGVLAIPTSAMLLLLPNISKLVLDRAGFEMVTPFRARRRVRWQDATGFQTWWPWFASKSSAVVGFDDSTLKGTKSALLNSSIAGRNSSLPDTYGLRADDLITLMNEWRERALK